MNCKQVVILLYFFYIHLVKLHLYQILYSEITTSYRLRWKFSLTSSFKYFCLYPYPLRKIFEKKLMHSQLFVFLLEKMPGTRTRAFNNTRCVLLKRYDNMRPHVVDGNVVKRWYSWQHACNVVKCLNSCCRWCTPTRHACCYMLITTCLGMLWYNLWQLATVCCHTKTITFICVLL